MNLNSDGINFMDSSSNKTNPTNPSVASSQPWWFGMSHGALSMDVLGENRKSSSPTEPLDRWFGTKSSGLQGSSERINANKEMQSVTLAHTDGKFEEKKSFLQPTQLELVGPTIAPSYPYAEPYYGGAVPAYGPSTLVHPQCLGGHASRMALPLEMAEEPVYVNAKQYHGILRRRQLRAKLELEKKLIKVRKPYLHESRHLHAMRRARGCGGRFLNTKKLENNASSATPPGKGSSTGNNADSSNGYREVQQQAFSNSNDHESYVFHGFQLSTSRTGEQHERMVLTGVPHRALTIK